MKKLILFLLLSLMFSNETDRTFHLKNGDKITGEVLTETEISYDIKTSFGKVTIFKDEIKDDKITITLKSGDKITGTLLDESNSDYKVKTTFGELTIAKDSVEYINFLNKVNIDSNNPISKKDDGRFYYGDEQLVDIWFDPVGFPLSENTLYFSGLSWAYGISDKLQISSKWASYFYGDLNFRPKYMVYKGGDVDKTNALSIGFDFHMRGLPRKYEYADRGIGYSYYCTDGDCSNDTPSIEGSYPDQDEVDKTWKRIGSQNNSDSVNSWDQRNHYFDNLQDCISNLPDGVSADICNEEDGNWYNYKYETYEYDSYNYGEPDIFEASKPWGEIFLAFTQSNLKKSGQGRINYNGGLSITFYDEYDPMPRFYTAIDIDARKNLKLMAEIAYDEYYVPWFNWINDEETMPIHFDFGFMYTYSDNLRFGIHYQSPFIAFYYKF